MTATNDPLARVQAMVDAWGSAEAFDTFDISTSEVSPPDVLQDCGFGHSRQFRHQGSEHVARRDASARVDQHEADDQECASRVVAYSCGVETVESVENVRTGRNHSDLACDTGSLAVSKNAGRVSKTGRAASPEVTSNELHAPPGVPAQWIEGIAKLPEMPCPARFPAARWAEVVTDAAAFLREWAAAAHRLGWPAWELFGCYRRAPWGRIQGMGLVRRDRSPDRERGGDPHPDRRTPDLLPQGARPAAAGRAVPGLGPQQ
jgi:hypothetical protein